MRIELIINSTETESLEALREGVAGLRMRSNEVRAHVTFEEGDATRFARGAIERGAEIVIAAGGDGTLNEVVNGLMSAADPRGPERLPRFGIVPLGTGNDFAAFLDIPESIDDALELAVDGREMLLDVARINDRYFLNVSSGGIAAEATEDASDRSKRLLGPLAYFVTGVRKLAPLHPSIARFTSNGEVIFDGSFLFFAVGNGGRAGGGNWITPRADVTDGLLDLCIVKDMTHAEFLRMLPELRTGDHAGSPHVLYRQMRKLRVEPTGPLSVNVDGEPVDEPAFSYGVIPGALRATVGVDPGLRS